MKKCFKCKENKPFADFYKASKEKSGYQSHCKECYRKCYAKPKTNRVRRSPEYYIKDSEKLEHYYLLSEKEKKNFIRRERYLNDPEYKAKVKVYHQKEYSKQSAKERARKKARDWASSNPDKVRENRIRWTSENRQTIKEKKRAYWNRAPKEVIEKRLAYLKEYRKTDNRKAVVRNYAHKRRSKIQETDITSRWLKNFLTKSLNCEICGCVLERKGNIYPNGKQLDHILPIAIGGEHKMNNVRVICLKCNVSRPKDGSDILKLVI